MNLVMKRTAVLVVFLIVSSIVFCQEKQLEYSAEVPVTNATVKELHDRCLDWFSRNFNLPNKIYIESTDDKIIALPYLLYSPRFLWGSAPVEGTITYTFEVDCSDGAFTYIINNFVHQGNIKGFTPPINYGLITTAIKSPPKYSEPFMSQLAWNDIRSQISEYMTPLIKNLKEEMTRATEKKSMDSQP